MPPTSAPLSATRCVVHLAQHQGQTLMNFRATVLLRPPTSTPSASKRALPAFSPAPRPLLLSLPVLRPRAPAPPLQAPPPRAPLLPLVSFLPQFLRVAPDCMKRRLRHWKGLWLCIRLCYGLCHRSQGFWCRQRQLRPGRWRWSCRSSGRLRFVDYLVLGIDFARYLARVVGRRGCPAIPSPIRAFCGVWGCQKPEFRTQSII